MKQENKELLLKNICSRLPYRQVCVYKESSYEILGCLFNKINIAKPILSEIKWIDIEDCKPYLRSMDSMTDEEREELKQVALVDNEGVPGDIPAYIDWLNKKMFDYHGLIPLGLVLEAPKGMYN